MNPETASSNQFSEIAAELRSILQPYEAHLTLTSTGSNEYSLDTSYILPNKKPLFFASVQPRKNYVSFYLMPVYVFPELLNGITDALRKRMQGKSCFNFKKSDPTLMAELAALTRAGYERYKAAGFVE